MVCAYGIVYENVIKSIRRGESIMLIYFIGLIYYLETAFRIIFSSKIISSGLFYALIFAIPIGGICYLISTSVKPHLQKCVVWGFTIGLTFIFVSQFIYYKIFRVFYTIYSALHSGQIFEFWQTILVTVRNNFFGILALCMPLILVFLGRRRFKVVEPLSKRGKMQLVSGLVLCQLIAVITLHIGDKSVYTPYDLYYQHDYPIIAAEKLGLMTTLRLTTQRVFFAAKPEEENYGGITIISEEELENNSSSIETMSESIENIDSSTQLIEEKKKYNVLNIDFERLIEEETSEDIIDMHNYFKEVEPTAKSAYTGKYKGYNLILITAEGFSPYAISKEMTPTLYKLAHEGYQFTNFYTPLWELSTSDGEYAICTGQIPKSGVWSMAESGENIMPFTLGNQLKQEGYMTRAFHNHTYDYYNRDISHPNLGYIYEAKDQGLDIEDTWPESDLEMMQETVDKYIGEEAFHTYYMTVSGHMNYSFIENAMAKKNEDLVQDLPLSETGKAYIACQIELDRAIEHLINQLEEADVLDHTLIAITPDHYPYGLNNEELSGLAGEVLDEDFDIYKSVFILYTPGMTPQVVDKPCSSLDVLPTLLNLMGLPYDSRLFVGKDIFSDNDGLVMLYSRNFITDKGRYNALTKEFIVEEEETVDEAYVEDYITLVDKKFYYSAKILEEDYYRYILEGIEE